MRKMLKICDVCGLATEDVRNYTVLSYRKFDDIDGKTRCPNLLLEQVNVDMCVDCARKSTNIHSIGIVSGEYMLEKNPEI